jgi:heme O synthase-like polyprenyltransferase
MLTRVFLPGTILLLLVVSLLLIPIKTQNYNEIETKSLGGFFYLFFFWLLTHVWIIALKKQRKYSFIRINALYLVPIIGVILGFVIELFQNKVVQNNEFQIIDVIYAFFGTVLGILSFCLLYRKCY